MSKMLEEGIMHHGSDNKQEVGVLVGKAMKGNQDLTVAVYVPAQETNGR